MAYEQNREPSDNNTTEQESLATPNLVQNIDSKQNPVEKLAAITAFRDDFSTKFGKNPEQIISEAKTLVAQQIKDAIQNSDIATQNQLQQLTALPSFIGAIVNSEISKIIEPVLNIDAQKLRAILTEEVHLNTKNSLANLKDEVEKKI